MKQNQREREAERQRAREKKPGDSSVTEQKRNAGRRIPGTCVI